MDASDRSIAIATALIFGIATAAPAGAATSDHACSATAKVGFKACKLDTKDDRFEGQGICLNESDPEERASCDSELNEEFSEAREECRDVFDARLDLCEQIGEAPYDPDFDPADFETDFGALSNPNPYLPIASGNAWEYAGGDETISVVVTPETKLIEGVTCITINDQAAEDGEVIEDTDDWVAHAIDGSVHYCGEIAKNFESFEGDVPDDPELVDVEGSWKAGREGAKSGVLMPAAPEVGRVYRQEWAFGDAEDAAEVLSTTYGYGAGELDSFVPEDLAGLLCAGDCLVTRDFTPLEPDASELKYYAPGIGLFLEVDPAAGEIVQLVDCNVDARCAVLPQP